MSRPAHPGAPGFAVERTDRGDAVTLALVGELDLAGVPDFEAATDGLEAAADVTVDLRRLDFLDSSGLGCLMTLDLRARAGGFALRLAGPRPDVLGLLRLCGVHERIPIVGGPEAGAA